MLRSCRPQTLGTCGPRHLARGSGKDREAPRFVARRRLQVALPPPAPPRRQERRPAGPHHQAEPSQDIHFPYQRTRAPRSPRMERRDPKRHSPDRYATRARIPPAGSGLRPSSTPKSSGASRRTQAQCGRLTRRQRSGSRTPAAGAHANCKARFRGSSGGPAVEHGWT